MKIQSLSFRKNNKILILKIVLIAIAGMFWFSLFNPWMVTGQSSDQTWITPANLSHTGSTSNPAIVSTPDKTIYAVWQDAYTGSVFSEFEGGHWSNPKATKFPFDTYIPRLLSNSNGRIYAFWIDSQGALFRSYVEQPNFGKTEGWAETRQVSDSALSFDIAMDDENQIHLVYIHSLETPETQAGLYYRHTVDTITFSAPEAVYQTPYFRGLSGNLANVQISVSGKGQTAKVYTAWDNPLRKEVFLARSEDGGKTWNKPQVIDSSDQASGTNTPFKINVNADGEKVLLIWQKGEVVTSGNAAGGSGSTASGSVIGNCTQLYQSSSDSGKTWSNPQEMLKDLSSCAQDYQFLTLDNTLTLLMLSTIQNKVFMVAWDGSSWSAPQAQPTLSGFEDPEIFNRVIFGCRQTSQLGNEEIMVVGCDIGGGSDIWVTSRSLGSSIDWYSPPVWNSPIPIVTSQSEIFSPVAIAGPGEGFHVFWNQADETNPNTQAIYYTSLNGERWSRPVAILSSPEGKNGSEAVKLDSKGRLLITWSGGKSGQIYFSWANAAKAVNKSEWTTPQVVPTPGQGAASPDIITDAQGTIYIVYAIPLNEHRGIYINQTADDGNTWTDPIKVFDGASANWDMVNQPQLVSTPNGSLHVFWTRYTLPGGDGPLGVYESHSVDKGKTWSPPTTIVEASVKWSQALGTAQGPMQFVWMEQNSGRQVIKHQYSEDNGLTWNRTATFYNVTNIQGYPAAITDNAGRLHLLLISEENDNNLLLKHLMWDGQKWLSDDNYDISQDSVLKVDSVGAGITQAGKLDVIYSGVMAIKQGNPLQYTLSFTNRSIEVPKIGVFSSLPTSSTEQQTPIENTSTPTVSPTGTPSPSSTPDQSLQIPQPQNGNSQGGNDYSGLILGAGLAVVIAILFLGLRLRSMRSRRG